MWEDKRHKIKDKSIKIKGDYQIVHNAWQHRAWCMGGCTLLLSYAENRCHPETTSKTRFAT